MIFLSRLELRPIQSTTYLSDYYSLLCVMELIYTQEIFKCSSKYLLY
jgi:hypothetical protein